MNMRIRTTHNVLECADCAAARQALEHYNSLVEREMQALLVNGRKIERIPTGSSRVDDCEAWSVLN